MVTRGGPSSDHRSTLDTRRDRELHRDEAVTRGTKRHQSQECEPVDGTEIRAGEKGCQHERLQAWYVRQEGLAPPRGPRGGPEAARAVDRVLPPRRRDGAL